MRGLNELGWNRNAIFAVSASHFREFGSSLTSTRDQFLVSWYPATVPIRSTCFFPRGACVRFPTTFSAVVQPINAQIAQWCVAEGAVSRNGERVQSWRSCLVSCPCELTRIRDKSAWFNCRAKLENFSPWPARVSNPDLRSLLFHLSHARFCKQTTPRPNLNPTQIAILLCRS